MRERERGPSPGIQNLYHRAGLEGGAVEPRFLPFKTKVRRMEARPTPAAHVHRPQDVKDFLLVGVPVPLYVLAGLLRVSDDGIVEVLRNSDQDRRLAMPEVHRKALSVVLVTVGPPDSGVIGGWPLRAHPERDVLQEPAADARLVHPHDIASQLEEWRGVGSVEPWTSPGNPPYSSIMFTAHGL